VLLTLCTIVPNAAMLSVVMLSVVILSVIMPSVVMLSVTLLTVVVLSVVLMSVVASLKHLTIKEMILARIFQTRNFHIWQVKEIKWAGPACQRNINFYDFWRIFFSLGQIYVVVNDQRYIVGLARFWGGNFTKKLRTKSSKFCTLAEKA
jgi:hypothetical protein